MLEGLADQAALLRGAGRARCLARPRRFERCQDQLPQAFERIGPVALLGAVRACHEQQGAVVIQAVTGARAQTLFDPGIECLGILQVEPQLDGGGDLVHVLATRSG